MSGKTKAGGATFRVELWLQAREKADDSTRICAIQCHLFFLAVPPATAPDEIKLRRQMGGKRVLPPSATAAPAAAIVLLAVSTPFPQHALCLCCLPIVWNG